MQVEPVPVPIPLPTRATSPTLQSSTATEAVARKVGLVRSLDRNQNHPMTLRPPQPVYSDPSEARLVAPPLLWDQFLDDYGKSSGEVASDDGSSSFLMGPPAPTGEWRTPGDGGVWNGRGSSVQFYDKYWDPDGHDGWLWFRLKQGGVDVSGTPAQGNLATSGGQSTWWTSVDVNGGVYAWDHRAQDVTNEWSGYFDEFTLYVNNPAYTPTPIAPATGATLPTPQPVLSVSGGPPWDWESDYIAREYRVTSDSGCNTVVVSSGWLPMGATTWTPPLGALKDGQDYYWCARATDFVGRHYGSGESAWSSPRLLKIRLPKRGVQSYWPMFSRGPVSVNEATGNLVISVPGPSFSSAAGSIGGSFTFNSFDTRGSVFPAATDSAWVTAFDGAPAKLIDHNLLTGDDKFDAVERIEGDGTSSYYSHVAGGNTYQAALGDPSMLAKTGSGFVLTDADGSIYTFDAASTPTGVAPLKHAEVSAAANGQAVLEYFFDSSGRPTQAIAKAKDAGGTLQTLQTLTFNWSCSGALVCITGPDAKEWRYEGETGSAGKLHKIKNGTLEILRIGYDGSGRPNSIKNANDLNPAQASTGHTSTHELQIAYDPSTSKVTAITEKSVRERYHGATPRDLVWSFAYTAPGTTTCPLSNRTPHAPDTNGGHTTATRTIVGCTDVTLPEPKASTGQANRISVFYDHLAHAVESVDALGNYALAHWNDRNTLDWTEDELKQPTDYEYDEFTKTLKSVKGPDPDGPSPAGPLPRPETTHFYDERAPGNGTTAGPALEGLQAFYYKNSDLTGRPEVIQNDATVNFDWTTTGPAALGGQKTNIGVRWTGILSVGAQADYVFATKAEAGTRLVVDGAPLIDKWTGQAFATPQCSPLVNLKQGKHRITLEYHQTTSTDTRVQLLWSAGGTASCANATTVVPSSSLVPGWQNQTSTITFDSTQAGTGRRLAFSHFAAPGSRQPDYTVADTTGAKLISSSSYDSFGRPTQRVTPKGNATRTIDTAGTLSGSVVSGYDVGYGYYAIGESASACGGSAVNQLGLPKHITPNGVAATTTTYNATGRPIATTKAAGTTCRSYDGEGRLTSEQAPGESQATTYAYDPAGLVRTVSDASGTVTTIYNESGLVIDSVDSYGAEMEVVYNNDGNPTLRRVATGPFGVSTVYDTEYRYNDDGQLVKQIILPGQANPSERTYEFSWDARGTLKATRYPNGTFSWNDYLANGALKSVFNRHGTLASPPPASGTPPADENALSDFEYDYLADGRRASETRNGDGLGTGETTSYTYDSVGRLASVSGLVNHTYCYDLNSNRTKLFSASSSGDCTSGTPDTSYSYSSSVLDQLSTVTPTGGSATGYGYDTDGNATGRGADALSWDGRGRHTGGSFVAGDPLANVQFSVDGVPHGSADTSSPYQVGLDTATLPNGWHTLGATASTSGGKQAAAPTRVVKIANGAVSDTTPPTVSLTAPSSGGVSGTVSVTATAADNVGVASVQFRRDGVDIGSDSSSPYSINWNTASTPNGSHALTAVALDAAGNATTSSSVSVSVSNVPTGLVAGYAYEEESGTTAVDSSGSGNTGTLTNGATRNASGQNGKALEQDGTDDYVSTADAASLDLVSAGTVMAWVRLDTVGIAQVIVSKGANSAASQNYALMVQSTNRPRCEIGDGSSINAVNPTATLSAGTWYHLACVWDGSTHKLYLDGGSPASGSQTITPAGNSAALAVGKYGGNSRYLDGRIDDVRIYNTALSQTEVQAAMVAPAGVETTAPSVSLTAPSGGSALTGTMAVSATATDNVGVSAVQFRRDGVDLGSDSSAPYSVSWDTSLTPNGPHTLTAVALDAAGNATTSSTVSVTVGEATPPTTPGAPSVTASAGKTALTWTAATDASGVAYYRVHRSTTSGFTPGAQNEIGQTTATGYTDAGDGSTHGLQAGTYYYRVVALDQLGNVSAASGEGSGAVSADTTLPRISLASPTPVGGSTVSGQATLAADAAHPTTTSTLSYGFDPAGFRRSRTLNGATTRFLLGGLIETTAAGTITGFDVDGPAGDLAHYTSAPSSSVNPSYSYYSGHGDLAAEANHSGARTRVVRLDPWGTPLTPPSSPDLQELFTGRWDKKHDQLSLLIEMGARPYEPAVGRFLSVDPVDGGALNEYDYAGQDPVNEFDLDGRYCDCGKPKKRGPIDVARGIWGAIFDAVGGVHSVSKKASQHVPKSAKMSGAWIVKYGVPGALGASLVADVSSNMRAGDSFGTAVGRAFLKTAGGVSGAALGARACIGAIGTGWGAVGCALIMAPVGGRAGEARGERVGNWIFGRR